MLEIFGVWADMILFAGLRYTGVWNSAAVQANDVSAAVLSGLEKRVPTFEKL